MLPAGAMKWRLLGMTLAALVGASACRSRSPAPDEHRAADVACPAGTPVASTNGGACQSAAECAAGGSTPASCVFYPDVDASFCSYDACDLDTQCADAGVCVCAQPVPGTTAGAWNTCAIGGNCRVDADCAPVAYCSPSSIGCGSAIDWFCHTPSDACFNDSDCPDYQTCQYAPSARSWQCASATSCVGQ